MNIEHAVAAWHKAINARNEADIRRIVSDNLEITGPKGSEASADDITGPMLVMDWLERSGITLKPVDWHPVDDETMVVAEDARWPGNDESTPCLRAIPSMTARSCRSSDIVMCMRH